MKTRKNREKFLSGSSSHPGKEAKADVSSLEFSGGKSDKEKKKSS